MCFPAKGIANPCLMLLALVAVLPVHAEVETSTHETYDLIDLSIKELLSVEFYGASKFMQKTVQTPANVTIITAADIKRYGYRTLANVLNSVRGMNASYDLNYDYLGVRGSGRAGDSNSRTVQVEGEAGKGTLFTVTLPAVNGRGAI
jgi:iron complex outermembrane receptor protein